MTSTHAETVKLASTFVYHHLEEGDGFAAFCLKSGDTHFVRCRRDSHALISRTEGFTVDELKSSLDLTAEEIHSLIDRLREIGMLVSTSQ